MKDGEECRLEPDKSEHGPVSILEGVADERVILLRNGMEIGRAMRPEAVAAISIRAPFMRVLSLIISPGTTIFVTEAPVLATNLHAGFTVLTNDAPDSEAN